MIIICGHKWTQNQRKTLKISGKKCIFTNNRLKITGFETFISIGYLSAILIAPNAAALQTALHAAGLNWHTDAVRHVPYCYTAHAVLSVGRVRLALSVVRLVPG